MEASDKRHLSSVVWLFAVSLLGVTAQGANSFPPASRYVLDAGQGTILQSGGFAGVHWTYAVEGQFCLIVDEQAGTAWFEQVDANAVDESETAGTLDPNEVFHLEDLTGTVVDETAIKFTGRTDDGSTVTLTLTAEDDTAWLTGETTPPPNSADFFVFQLDATATRKYAGGTGDPNTPYLIATAEQMNAIGAASNDWDKHFRLTADIDLSAYDGQDGRPAFNIIAPDIDPNEWDFQGTPFTGVFDGNHHTISSLRYSHYDISPFGNSTCCGLFGCITDPNAEIKNLRLVDPNVDVPDSRNVGTLAGWLMNGTIDNCHVDGGVVSGNTFVGGLAGQIGSHGQGTDNDRAMVVDSNSSVHVIGIDVVGGLAGGNLGGAVTRCSANGSVYGSFAVGGLLGCNKSGIVTECNSAGRVTGSRSVGGLFGTTGICNCFCISTSTTFDCYTTASVEGHSRVGGLIGSNVWGWLQCCYSAGDVRGNETVGGLLGDSDVTRMGAVERCFWDVEASGQDTSAAGTGLPTAEMQTAAPFLEAGWDFVGETANGVEDIWWIDEGRDYPRLWWEATE